MQVLRNQGKQVSNMKQTLTPIKRTTGKSITMSFLQAMEKIIEGKKVARISWGNADYCLLKSEWLTIYTRGAFYTWSISENDITDAQDWIVVKRGDDRPKRNHTQ